MKYVIPMFLMALLWSCSGQNHPSEDDHNSEKISYVQTFLNDFEKFDELPSKNPIEDFQKESELGSDMVIKLTHENMDFTIEKAKEYKHTVITVGNHTIAKLTDIEDCQQSGSWEACVPMSKAYIKKGDMEETTDYLNNIIGTPDEQLRIVYFFN